MNELVTVLMPVYNTKESWLRLAIESILNQSYGNIEILIIIDSPTDHSASVVEEYAGKDRRIRIACNESNLGIVNSLNKGISLAKGNYIARMDSDDISLENRIEKQIEYLKEHELDIVGGQIIRINEHGEQISKPTFAYSEEQVREVLQYTNCFAHPTWFVKADVYKKLVGYRDIKYCEDYDFLLRARQHGYKMGMCSDIVLMYRMNSSGITRSNYLKQFLITCFLQKNLNNIDNITQSDIDRYLTGKINESEERRALESYSLFRSAARLYEEKHIMHSAIEILAGLTKSKYAFANLKNIILVRRIKKNKN